MEKTYYKQEQYNKDIQNMYLRLKNQKNIHLVSIYRGSLGMGAHLSNILDVPLSIIKYQSYDSNDKEVEFIHNAGIKEDDWIVVLDDIGDTYKTLDVTYEFFNKKFPGTHVSSFTLHGRKDLNNLVPDNTYFNEHPDSWIVYPWESVNILSEF